MDSIEKQLQKIFSNSIKITQNNVIFCYFVKFYSYCGKFQPSYETKKSMENDNEANPERSGYDGQTHVR